MNLGWMRIDKFRGLNNLSVVCPAHNLLQFSNFQFFANFKSVEDFVNFKFVCQVLAQFEWKMTCFLASPTIREWRKSEKLTNVQFLVQLTQTVEFDEFSF